MSNAQSQLCAQLPDAVRGWKAASQDETYGRDNLFDYIDGGAELYLSYGFAQLTSRTYRQAGQADIIVDVFDMGASKNAFGVFSHSAETVDDAFGQGSQYTGGLLLLWKDRFYVSILASPETDESKKAVLELARHIEAAIPHTGPLPDIVSLLPRESLDEASIRYFRHHIWLNSHYFVADENILHIDDGTDAVLAKYGRGNQRSILLLVRYETAEDARTGYDDFVRHYLPEKAERSVVQIEDKTWAGCLLDGRLLAVVLAATTEEAAGELLSAVNERRGGE